MTRPVNYSTRGQYSIVSYISYISYTSPHATYPHAGSMQHPSFSVAFPKVNILKVPPYVV